MIVERRSERFGFLSLRRDDLIDCVDAVGLGYVSGVREVEFVRAGGVPCGTRGAEQTPLFQRFDAKSSCARFATLDPSTTSM